MIRQVKKFLIGPALPEWEYKHQRLTKKLALAVFSSDALSSVAYATEEILLVLVTAGAAFLSYSLPISLIILLLLWVLIVSYRQTIQAYPNGGGAYIVAKENIGTIAGLTAASALLLDYILTAAVSVAAGVAALTSAFPGLHEEKVVIGVIVLMFITIMNLRGIKESGTVFAVPTYMFIISFGIMLAAGLYDVITGNVHTVPTEDIVAVSGFSFFLLLRAFSSGCAALTGVEAISNGVPAFKEPESKNAKQTLTYMALVLSVLFIGITYLSYQYHIVPSHERTVISLLAESIFGRGIMFYVIQAFTMLILFLAANTSYADFPRLCFFLSKDRFMPNQFKQLGDRLVFSTGIIFLGLSASLLIAMFQGTVHLLIPLYAVGVFTSFTLSQVGMVRKNIREKKARWKRKAFANAVGATMTFIALIIIAATKFLAGAWLIIILIPLLIVVFLKIHSHYECVASQLSVSHLRPPLKLVQPRHIIIVLVPSFHKGTIQALEFAKSFCSNVVALHIKVSGADTERLKEKWEKFKPGVPLQIIDSPYRKLLAPLMRYIDEIEKKDKKLNVTVVITEFVPRKWWQFFLHNQTALALKTALHFRPRTNYISLQYHLHK